MLLVTCVETLEIEWQVLGVSDSADFLALRRAYRKLALRYHPDKHQGKAKIAAQRKFQEVARAYEASADMKGHCTSRTHALAHRCCPVQQSERPTTRKAKTTGKKWMGLFHALQIQYDPGLQGGRARF